MDKVSYVCGMKKGNKKWSKYSTFIELQMVCHYNSLSEQAKRHYAAIECIKLGYGGKSYICKLFKMGINRLKRGLREMISPNKDNEPLAGKIRCAGGGRKKFCG